MEDDIKILIGIDGLQQYLSDVNKVQSATQKTASKSSDALKKNTGAWQDLQREVPLVGKAARLIQNPIALAAAAITGATAAIVSFTKAANEQIKVEAQLDAVLKSTGNAAGLSATQLKDLASSLQEVTLYGDEAIIGAENILLTFTNIKGQNFKDATKSVLNLATALGTDLKSATLQVGKAINEPVAGVNALARSGIQFSNDQKALIKSLVDTGQVAEAQKIILKELETQFGGSAEAAAKAGLGGFKQLQNTIGDLKEDIGFAFLPIAQELAKILKGFLEPLKNNRDLFEKLGKATADLFNAVIDLGKSYNELLVSTGLVDEDFNAIRFILEVLIQRTKNYVELLKAFASGLRFVRDTALTFSDALGITNTAADDNRKRLLNLKDSFYQYGQSLGLSVQQVREFIVNQKDLSAAVASGKLSTNEALKIGRERLLAYADQIEKNKQVNFDFTSSIKEITNAVKDQVKEIETISSLDISLVPNVNPEDISNPLVEGYEDALTKIGELDVEDQTNKFQQLAELFKGNLEDIEIEEFITNAVASLDKLAFKLGEAAGAGQGLGAVLGGFVKDLLVEIPKLIGYALIASATTPKAISTFPANLGLIAVGLGLIGASGLISGLLDQYGNDNVSSTAQEPSFGVGGGAIGTGTQSGLGSFGEEGATVRTYVNVSIDGDELASKVEERTQLTNELRAR